MKAFLFNFNPIPSVEYIHYTLNNTSSVETWVAPLQNSAILISKLTVHELAAVLHSHFRETWFVLIEANSENTNGWLPNDFWEYLFEPNTVWSKKLVHSFLPNNVPPPPPPKF